MHTSISYILPFFQRWWHTSTAKLIRAETDLILHPPSEEANLFNPVKPVTSFIYTTLWFPLLTCRCCWNGNVCNCCLNYYLLFKYIYFFSSLRSQSSSFSRPRIVSRPSSTETHKSWLTRLLSTLCRATMRYRQPAWSPLSFSLSWFVSPGLHLTLIWNPK